MYYRGRLYKSLTTYKTPGVNEERKQLPFTHTCCETRGQHPFTSKRLSSSLAVPSTNSSNATASSRSMSFERQNESPRSCRSALLLIAVWKGRQSFPRHTQRPRRPMSVRETAETRRFSFRPAGLSKLVFPGGDSLMSQSCRVFLWFRDSVGFSRHVCAPLSRFCNATGQPPLTFSTGRTYCNPSNKLKHKFASCFTARNNSSNLTVRSDGTTNMNIRA